MRACAGYKERDKGWIFQGLMPEIHSQLTTTVSLFDVSKFFLGALFVDIKFLSVLTLEGLLLKNTSCAVYY